VKPAVVLGLAIAAACAVILQQKADAQQADAQQAGQDVATPEELSTAQNDPITSLEDWATANIIESDTVNQFRQTMPDPDTNIRAMLEAIAKSEGTAGKPDPYRVCFGYRHTVENMADHPAVTREWMGEPLSDHVCAGAGLGAGCVSTAAGKFQIVKKTWIAVKNKLQLPDFSPASQDRAAIELLRQRGALGPLARGDFAGAVAAAKKEWASLPGAGYGQGERTIAWLTARYQEAGGMLA
jgi:muramidase (phage lysozyme)